MEIPNWVEKGKRTKAERARARLDFIMKTLAARHVESASMRGLGKLVGMDHSTLSLYIRRGVFTDISAKRISEALKDPTLIPILTDPLSLPKSPG